MEVTYCLTIEDRRHAQKIVGAQVRAQYPPFLRNKGTATFILLSPLILAALAILALHANRIIDGQGMIGILAGCLWGMCSGEALGRFWGHSFARSCYAPGHPLLKTHRMKVTDTGLEVASPDYSGSYPWTAIKEIRQDGRIVLLCLSPGYSIIVPAKAFADDEARQRFIGMVKERISAAA